MADVRERGLRLSGGGRPDAHVPPRLLRTATEASAVAGSDVVLVTVKARDTRVRRRRRAPRTSARTPRS